MFQGLSIKFKKTSKNTQSKKANNGKTVSLESTRSTSLSESFLERFDNLGVNDNSGSNSYNNAKMSESYERTLARIIENQGEILSELKVIKDKVRRIENRLNDLEQKMDNSFDITNDKAFKKETIKGATKALIEKAIYPENTQIKSEAEKYVRENYAEYFEKFTLKDWNVYYMNNIHGPANLPVLQSKGYGNLIEPINNKANLDEVIIWKKSTKTNEYGKAPPKKIAYAIAVCQTMLNPKNKIITMLDHIVKKLIAINLNKLKYRKPFSISSSEDKASQEDRDKSDDNDSENDNIEQGMDLDPEEVQEAEKDTDEDVDKEKDTDDYEKNTNNDELSFLFCFVFFIYE
ncbi:hypothetical protein F8M41_010495 [Gigaspora margarita]|uniref:Uncharacterized protein n=1 Tax=Gigaspora margarita TaxID=4874 RepID=A0A8H3X0K6_GIGMA|nr:hypothetical protein F8M41_010495 [Gigaspora margarita]